MTIYERLERDHDKQKALAKKLMETSGDSEERRRLFQELKTEAEAHADAEEQTLYATMMEHPDGQEKARHSVSEHKEAADLLEGLSKLDMGSGGWLRKFEKLKEELEHHIEEEQKEVFRLAKTILNGSDAERLAAEFEDRKSREMSRSAR